MEQEHSAVQKYSVMVFYHEVVHKISGVLNFKRPLFKRPKGPAFRINALLLLRCIGQHRSFPAFTTICIKSSRVASLFRRFKKVAWPCETNLKILDTFIY